MKKIMAYLICMVLLCGLFNGCESQDSDKIEYVIGVSQSNMREAWRLVLVRELQEEAAKHPNIRLVFTDATQNNEKQIRDIDRLLGYGIDLLIVSPCDVHAITPVVSEVYKSIPVIVLDRAVDGFDYSLFIGPDNKLIGKQAGEAVAGLLDDWGGAVLEVCGNMQSTISVSRSEGFRSVVSQYENIQVDQLEVPSESRDKAEDILMLKRDELSKYKVVFAHNDYMALAARRVVEQAGYEDIHIVGIDGFTGENDGVGLVRRGLIDQTISCPTGGREAIRYALDILNHASGIPKQIILRSHSITAENVDEYIDDLQSTPGEPKYPITVGYSQVGSESAWRLANTKSIQDAAKDFGIDLIYDNADQSQTRQFAAVREFIAQKVDVIVISPVVDSGWDEVLYEAQAAGIPVLLSDRTIIVQDDSLFMTYFGVDAIEEGRRAMRWLVKNAQDISRPVRIMELQGTIGASPTLDRKQGFGEILAENLDYAIVFSKSGDFTYEGGKQLVEEYLNNAAWDIDVIFSHNDDMALGAVEALKQHGIAPGVDVKIISVDATKPAFEAMSRGEINCLVECSPLLGPQLMKAITDLSLGKELPVRIITEEKVFTQEDVEAVIHTRTY